MGNSSTEPPPLEGEYANDPVRYAIEVLQVKWWAKQIEIAQAVALHKKVAVKASHGIGKTFLAGGLVNWHYDSFDPGLTLTTAPTAVQVNDLTWKEVRRQRRGRPGLMPKAPRMESSEIHFAVGYTARDANAFQGRHERKVFVIFEEAVGVDGEFWDAAEGIISGGDCRWLTIYNPTDTSSRAYEEELSGDWEVITVSALEHPNVLAGLTGEPEPYPGAVSLPWVEERLRKWCDRLGADKQPGAIEWPPGSGIYYKPGPLFESRVLGRWPSSGLDTVWSETLWEAALVEKPLEEAPLEIGCDVARFGDDWTVIHARRGKCSIHHERHNGWATNETAGRLKQLAKELALKGEDPKIVPIKIDDDGVGGGVVDNGDDFNFQSVSAAEVALETEMYPNRRSELWFATANRAREGRIDLSRIPEEMRKLIRRQLLTPKWKLDSDGRRVVERKEDTKKRLKKNNPELAGGSPDDADALNLAYAPATTKAFAAATGGKPNPAKNYQPR
jgi:hypothetical protein